MMDNKRSDKIKEIFEWICSTTTTEIIFSQAQYYYAKHGRGAIIISSDEWTKDMVKEKRFIVDYKSSDNLPNDLNKMEQSQILKKMIEQYNPDVEYIFIGIDVSCRPFSYFCTRVNIYN